MANSIEKVTSEPAPPPTRGRPSCSRALPRARAIVGLALVLASVAVPAAVASNSPADAPIEFLDGETVTLGADPVDVILVNNTDTEWELKWSATLVDHGTELDLQLAKAPASLPANGSVEARVAPHQGGTGHGFLQAVASSGTGTFIARLPLSAAALTPTPLVSTWEGRSPQTLSLTAATSSPPIPLADSSCPSKKDGTFWLASPAGAAEFRWICRTSGDGTELAVFAPDDLRVGSYTGTLTLGGQDVAAKYLKASAWFVALLPMIIGIFLAVWMRAYLDDWRPLKQAEKWIERTAERASSADREFAHAAGEQPFGAYRVAPGIHTALAALNSQLQELPPPWLRPAVAHWVPWGLRQRWIDHQQLLDEVGEIQTLANNWPTFAEDLAALSRTLDASEKRGTNELAPRVVEEARTFLHPIEPRLPAERAQALRVAVRDATHVLSLLPTVSDLMCAFEHDTTELPWPSDASAFAEARRAFRSTLARLSEEADGSRLIAAGIEAKITYARDVVTGLRFDERRAGAARAQGDTTRGLETAAPVTPFAWVERFFAAATRLMSSGKGTDLVALIIAVVVAGWSGLVAQYVDKPWGLFPQDWISMTVWSFGATAVLTPILTALGNIASESGRRPEATE